eukprot:m.35651 g.35651  ORF g.35651 m.35651 type:complete len:473 (-) comp13280_c0_seq1:65-1483(-)
MNFELLFSLFSGVPAAHIVVEVLLVLVVVKLVFFTAPYDPADKEKPLSKKEEDELIAEWEPLPLIAEVQLPEKAPPVVEGIIDTHVTIGGQQKINLATFNFLGFGDNKAFQKQAEQVIRKYGVGSCGPRGFYGTIDVHLNLETELAQFFGAEEAIIYSYGFSTIASVIPAYSKRGDVIFYDEAVSFPTQRGLIASRSDLRPFKHNDMNSLEDLLKKQAEDDKKNPKKAKVTRRFLVVEGVYPNTGNIAPLKKLVELKYKYKVRLVLEESFSFGALGRTGRGLTEHADVPVEDVDMLVGSLENALGSIGGFCVGRTFVVDHQRLSGQGYCFSASLPPYLAVTSSSALKELQQNSGLVANRRRAMAFLRSRLNKLRGLVLAGDPEAPILHLCLDVAQQNAAPTIAEQDALLQRVVDHAMEHGVALTKAAHVREEELGHPQPSIRLAVSPNHKESDLDTAAKAIQAAAQAVFQSL